MLKRPITFTFINDDDKEVSETVVHYFHLFEEELLEWESKYNHGLGAHLQSLVKQEDNEKIFAFFKKIILDSYGVREDGGRSFNKSDELKRDFEKTLAYKQLFKELCTDENAAGDFINGIFPKLKVQDKPAEAVATKTGP